MQYGSQYLYIFLQDDLTSSDPIIAKPGITVDEVVTTLDTWMLIKHR